MLKLLCNETSPVRMIPLLSTAEIFCRSDRFNAHRAAISRMKRSKYVRQYYVDLLQPDGSTIRIRASEPLDLIQMPFNLDALTDEERLQREMKRHKTQTHVKREETVRFNADQYIDLWRKSEKKP